MDKIQKALEETYKNVKKIKSGKNASYIPELKKVNPNIYGISICTCDGTIYNIGDFNKEVAIESVAKVFSLILAIEKKGKQNIQKMIGQKSSFLPFNSLIAVELSNSHTINPFVNAGAMATTSILYEKNKNKFWKLIKNNLNKFAGHDLKFSKKIYISESKTNNHNKSIAYLLKSYGKFYGEINSSLDVYTKQGSVLVTSKDVSIMASTLSNGGINPITKKKTMSKKNIKYVLGQMMGGGLYEYSNTWMTEIGIPGKSGVGGVIMCVVPGIMGIGIVSPPLNKEGNSVKGIKTAKMLSEKLNLSILNKSF
jgi:glutaminase